MMNFRLWLESRSKEAALKNPSSAFSYARDEIGGRWPEGEAIIAKRPYWAYSYAAFVLRDKWPEAEAVIAKDPSVAWLYAKDVIKDRWPEAEAVIAKNPFVGERYLDFILGPIYDRIEGFDDFVKHPDVIGLAKNFPLIKGVINKRPKALRKFYMEIAPKFIRDMMLRYEA